MTEVNDHGQSVILGYGPGMPHPAHARSINRDATRATAERNTRTTIEADVRTFDRKSRRDGSRRFDRPRRYDRPRAVRVIYPHREARHVGFTWKRRPSGYRSGSVFRHIVWPRYGYPVFYRHGPDLFVHYYRPSYHRKFIFFSIGRLCLFDID